MAETVENTVVHTPAEQESGSAAVGEETCPIEALDKILELSPDVGLSGCAASEETDGREKLKQVNGQKDKQTVSPPAAEPSYTGLKPDWKPGSQCRAVYSGDGLIYPAVVLWVKGQRCCIRYDDYNNEEEHDVGSLLSPNELYGPSRATSAKGSRWTSVSSRREEKPGERGAERRSDRWRDEQHSAPWTKERPSYQTKVEKEEKKSGDKPTNHSFSFFPPFPPPPQSKLGDSASYIPPPPPPLTWAVGGKESAGFDSASSMLMLWYMCGFHTGSYLTQQASRSSSKD